MCDCVSLRKRSLSADQLAKEQKRSQTQEASRRITSPHIDDFTTVLASQFAHRYDDRVTEAALLVQPKITWHYPAHADAALRNPPPCQLDREETPGPGRSLPLAPRPRPLSRPWQRRLHPNGHERRWPWFAGLGPLLGGVERQGRGVSPRRCRGTRQHAWACPALMRGAPHAPGIGPFPTERRDHSSAPARQHNATPPSQGNRCHGHDPLTCPPKTGPRIMRVLDGNGSQGGQHAWEPVHAGADRQRAAGA